MSSLKLTPLSTLPLIQPGDDLAEIILGSLQKEGLQLADGDILVIAQKIVSKAEGRLRNLEDVFPSPQADELAVRTEKDPRLLELVLGESSQVLRTKPGTIIVEHRLGFVCANAGIDHSNVQGEPVEGGEWVLLLPEDPDATARRLRQRFESASGVRLGVMIIDSHGRAWRLGTVGTAIGLSGLPSVVDLRGQSDLFGYRLQITQVGAADELAAAASLMMGQAAESTPVIHVRGFPYPMSDGSLEELLRPREQDLFRDEELDLLRRRRSVRRFSSRPVPEALLQRLLEAATWAPSAHNRQPWRFVVLRSPESRRVLAEEMGAELGRDLSADGMSSDEVEVQVNRSRSRIRGAPLAIMLCLDLCAGDHYPDEARQQAEHLMGVQSVALAGGHLLLAAHAEGLGGVWMCAPLFSQEAARRALDLPSDWQPQGLLLLGYPERVPPPRRRKPLSEVTVYR